MARLRAGDRFPSQVFLAGHRPQFRVAAAEASRVDPSPSELASDALACHMYVGLRDDSRH